jgi:DNA (cytosine-5)-methyltransferase 1
MTLRVLDLFSGIGGFSIGLERAGMRTVAFCEIDPYCRAVLRKHWPDVPIFEDVRKLTAADVPRVDVICGGFPCQPFSSASAGKARGTQDDRFLWPEMLRVIQECQPAWVIGENVTHIDRLALERVASDLEASGYEIAPPLEIPACAVGLDHWRSRYWFLGYSDSNSESKRTLNDEAPRMQGNRPEAGNARAQDGLPYRMDRRAVLGNAVVPQIPEIIGRAIMQAEGREDAA